MLVKRPSSPTTSLPLVVRASAICGVLVLVAPSAAVAGMPAFFLSDVASMRLTAVSFFTVIFLVAAKAAQLLWNAMRTDFAALPKLTYSRALQLLGVWGLAFSLVLTMISGARELMTPGAWVKQGATYKLTGSTRDTTSDAALAGRRERLERLRSELWRYAGQHGGRFPLHDLVEEIPAWIWESAHETGTRMIYAAGATPDQGAVPVAWEPGVYGSQRFVLLSSGEVTSLPIAEIQRRVAERAK